MAMVFETKQLTVGYRNSGRELKLFEDLDLRLNTGELICFMGPNGCGKSTLIRTLAGLQPPIAGSVPRKDERQVAIVLTDRIHSQHMTVLDLITYGRYPYLGWDLKMSETDQQAVRSSVELVRLGHLVGKKANELSDGQMQMVMIARALAQDTPVLLLDEPTAHLDLNNRLEIMNLLRRLARERDKSILLATHEIDLALQTADGVWLATGNSIKQGVPEDLVLDGSFDDVFQFKGYDLKTGKVQHEAYRNKSVHVIGEGPIVLWTRNALERNGYYIDESGEQVEVLANNSWMYRSVSYRSIEKLLAALL